MKRQNSNDYAEVQIMSNKVTFDYSKATSFIKEHEIANMKKLVLDAK